MPSTCRRRGACGDAGWAVVAAPLIIDLDGVLRRWRSVGPIEARHGLPDGALFAIAFSPALLTPVITGAVDDERWRADVAAALVAAHGPAAAGAVTQWSESTGEVDQDVLDLVRRYRRGGPGTPSPCPAGPGGAPRWSRSPTRPAASPATSPGWASIRNWTRCSPAT